MTHDPVPTSASIPPAPSRMHPPRTLSRRRLLKQSFAFSAAFALGLPRREVTAAEIDAGDLHFLTIGDWGDAKDLKPQSAVAAGMRRYVKDAAIRPEALLLLGDNFYGPFKGGTACPRWTSQFEDMYPAESFPGPCFAALGNHDYDDEPKDKLAAELAYAADHPGTRWTLPAKWYSFQFPRENPLVKFVVLDSNYKNRVISLTAEEKAAQDAWLNSELSKPRTAPWLVVMAHHPLYSNGAHGDHPHLIAEWEPLFRRHRVDLYLCGHDHDLQHMEFRDHPTSFVLSGGGGARVREIKEMKHGPYGRAIHGFSHLQLNKDRIILRHVDANRKLLHAFRKTPAGAVTILS